MLELAFKIIAGGSSVAISKNINLSQRHSTVVDKDSQNILKIFGDNLVQKLWILGKFIIKFLI